MYMAVSGRGFRLRSASGGRRGELLTGLTGSTGSNPVHRVNPVEKDPGGSGLPGAGTPGAEDTNMVGSTFHNVNMSGVSIGREREPAGQMYLSPFVLCPLFISADR